LEKDVASFRSKPLEKICTEVVQEILKRFVSQWSFANQIFSPN